MNSKQLYSIREWAPLSHVIERLPARTRLAGLFPAVDLNITCIAAVEEFLALGTDAGIVFWYNRESGDVQKLRAEVATRITCVEIVNSVEFMVAAGSSSGQVSVFQIQKALPPELNLACLRRGKPIQRYTIRDLHGSSVSCCAWSANGMKLFSGDRQGVVVLTEFDYANHLSKSVEILSEAYEIVQLAVQQSYLLVSTLYRSVVCQRYQSNGQWQLTQVGRKDRKQLVDCGGIFLHNKGAGPAEPLRLVCGRPGLRFWIADTGGNVERTLLFRDAVVRSPTWEIPTLNPKLPQHSVTLMATSSSNPDPETRNFRSLQRYADQAALLITHDDDALYVLNIERLCVEAVARGFRKILDFCVCGTEIFVLEGERSLLRLAPMPEKPNAMAKVFFNPLLPPPVPLLGTSLTASKLEMPVEYVEHDEERQVPAEECFELPPIEALDLHIPIELAVESPRTEQNRRQEIFQQISQMDFDQSIVHHSTSKSHGEHRQRRSKSRVETKPHGGIVEIGQAALRSDVGAADEAIPVKPKTLQLTTKSMPLEASFCLSRVIESTTGNTGGTLTQLHPDSPSPMVQEPQTPSKLLTTDSGVLSPRPPPPPPTTPAYASAFVRDLSKSYPQSPLVEDAGVQTTPRHRYYDMPDADCDYSDGQPVDDICATLQATKLLLQSSEAADRRYRPAQPHLNEEVHSFLLDFGRAGGDTMQRQSSQAQPQDSAESNVSSEWEFLNN